MLKYNNMINKKSLSEADIIAKYIRPAITDAGWQGNQIHQGFSFMSGRVFVKDNGKNYSVTYYALPMVLAVGFRVRSIRGTQFKTEYESYQLERNGCPQTGYLYIKELSDGNCITLSIIMT